MAPARSGLAQVAGEHDPERRDDLQVVAAEAVTNEHVGAFQPGHDRVAIAPPGDQAGVAHLAADLDRRRVRLLGQRQQVFFGGQFGDRPAAAAAGVAGLGAEAVVVALSLLQGFDRGRPPPALSGIVVGLFDLPLPPGAVGRTDRDGDAIVPGQGGEPGQQVAGLGVDRGRHPVDAPAAGGATEAADHLANGRRQVRLLLALGEAAAELGRVGEAGLTQVRLAAPGSVRELHPVPLHLLAGLVRDLGGDPAASAQAIGADRAQRASAELGGEALVAASAAQLADLVVEHGGPDIWIVAKPNVDVLLCSSLFQVGRLKLSLPAVM